MSDGTQLVCSECGNHHTRCDCPFSISRLAPLIPPAQFRGIPYSYSKQPAWSKPHADMHTDPTITG